MKKIILTSESLSEFLKKDMNEIFKEKKINKVFEENSDVSNDIDEINEKLETEIEDDYTKILKDLK